GPARRGPARVSPRRRHPGRGRDRARRGSARCEANRPVPRRGALRRLPRERRRARDAADHLPLVQRRGPPPAGLAQRLRRVDPRFAREGNDIFSTVDLTMTQAALGATVGVPTLEGDVELEFEPGTQPGEVRVLRGGGMPVLQGFGRGDHRFLVNVAIPARLTEEQRRLLAEFASSESEETYRPDEGFFGKLKSAFR